MDRLVLIKGFFNFDPQDPIYRDHFPGHAVVPGSLIIHAFMEAVAGMNNSPASWYITNFRFKRFVAPGRYAFRIERTEAGRMACRLYQNDETVVTGTL